MLLFHRKRQTHPFHLFLEYFADGLAERPAASADP